MTTDTFGEWLRLPPPPSSTYPPPSPPSSADALETAWQSGRQLTLPAAIDLAYHLDHTTATTLTAPAAPPIPTYVEESLLAVGGSLRDLLNRERRLPLQQVIDIGLELADALARAHHLNVIHRDLKPENILLAGRHPFAGDSLGTTMMLILNHPLPDLAQARPDTPPLFTHLLSRMLNRERAQRLASARQVAAELERIAAIS